MSGERKAKVPAKLTSAIDHDLIRELARLLEETGLSEIEFERNGQRVRVARQMPQGGPYIHATPAVTTAAEVHEGDALSLDPAKHPGVVTSPMVGTAYLAPEPGGAPYVKVGERVKKGQTLLIIEAMKVMNPIPAPEAGTVEQILINDGQPVEYGEPLLVLR